ncbi:hypothetical protein L228DRAFT_247557 [Xylona heveae TC161]|uniref:Uncharacterized protein n=1 Tax=Xylona heveae (strain CBS 132557 / TC161) TaxID=1328760 RepID=A0A165H7P9_XYLHT|nr:hypothetical protein L228DRAFT_247557 [Xylona heveae TC161]KZF23102.1 hypothetical protein L228DRAFT_247557 [Xylona heveae TC161]
METFKSMETVVGYNNRERFSAADVELVEAARMVFMDSTKLAHTMFPDLSTVKMQLAKHIANVGSRSYRNPEIFKYLSDDEYGGVYDKLAKGNVPRIYTFAKLARLANNEYHAVAKVFQHIIKWVNPAYQPAGNASKSRKHEQWKDLIRPYLNMSLPTKKFLNTQLDAADDFIVRVLIHFTGDDRDIWLEKSIAASYVRKV